MGSLRIVNIIPKQPNNNSLLNRTWLDKRKAATTYFQTPSHHLLKSKARPPLRCGLVALYVTVHIEPYHVIKLRVTMKCSVK